MPSTLSTTDEDLYRLLRSAEPFSSLLDDDVAYVASRIGFRRFVSGDVVFSEGDPATGFYIVKSGEIVVSKRMEGDRDVEMARYVAGDVIGDFDFVIGSAYSARAFAAAESELVVFPGDSGSLDDLMIENPDTVARILLRSLSMVASRLRSTNRLITENSLWLRELRKQLYTDPSTGLLNLSFMEAELPRSIEEPTAVIMLKPDHFKELNDSRGHAAGDEAMSRIAAALMTKSASAGRSWAIRLRSNETALIISRCDAPKAVRIARELSAAVAGISFPADDRNLPISLTASVSVSLWPEDGSDWATLVECANKALVKAWKEGGAKIYRARVKAGTGTHP
jgi:diguanylate cyclase (GGDEF)-like protein